LPIAGSEQGISMLKGNNEFHNDVFLFSEDWYRKLLFFYIFFVSGGFG
jgi:hypothetical protein